MGLGSLTKVFYVNYQWLFTYNTFVGERKHVGMNCFFWEASFPLPVSESRSMLKSSCTRFTWPHPRGTALQPEKSEPGHFQRYWSMDRSIEVIVICYFNYRDKYFPETRRSTLSMWCCWRCNSEHACGLRVVCADYHGWHQRNYQSKENSMKVRSLFPFASGMHLFLRCDCQTCLCRIDCDAFLRVHVCWSLWAQVFLELAWVKLSEHRELNWARWRFYLCWRSTAFLRRAAQPCRCRFICDASVRARMGWLFFSHVTWGWRKRIYQSIENSIEVSGLTFLVCKLDVFLWQILCGQLPGTNMF